MSVEVVIARYHENVDWTTNFDIMRVSTLYNKGNENDIKHLPFQKSLQLPNIGREGHTYLHHIITNYESLSDYTFFIQGKPFDHCHNIIEYILNPKDALQKRIADVYLTNHKMYIENLDNVNHVEIIPCMKRVCIDLFGAEPCSFDFGPGAILLLEKNQILSRPKSFYEKCIKHLENEVCPTEGFVFERLWGLIFNF
jgi:hypothetical protein